MKTSSHQNYGAVGINKDSDAVAAEHPQPQTFEPIEDFENSNSYNKRSRILRSILGLAVAFALFVVVLGSSPPAAANSALRGGSQMDMLGAAQADADSGGGYDITNPAANAPKPDYNGEGRYDWQKCKASNDPNCWKNEGERVGGYWENFGQRMKSYWMGFRHWLHDLFVGKEVAADDDSATTTTTTTTKKKASKKKSKKKAAAAPDAVATAAPEIPAIPDVGTDDDKVDDD